MSAKYLDATVEESDNARTVIDESDEHTLIEAAQKGDLTAFNTLVLRYQDAVYNITFRILGDPETASDTAQETFINVFRRLKTYRGRGFRAWLYRVTTNACYDILRRQKRQRSIPLSHLTCGDSDDAFPIVDPSATPEQAFQDHELSMAIQECINRLIPEWRVALIMRDIEGCSYQEIADAEQTKLGTIKSRISRARAEFRRCFKADRVL